MIMEPRSKNPRIAILITYADRSPFKEIVAATHHLIWASAPAHGIDIFYLSGKPISPLMWRINHLLERIRWSRFFPLLFLWDKLSFRRFRSRLPLAIRSGNSIEVQVPSGFRYLGITVLTGFRYLVNAGYSHIYKTTVSSVVNLEQLIAISTKDFGSGHLYAGSTIVLPDHKFVSGANLLVNSKTVDILFESRAAWRHELLDDVAIGRLLENKVSIVDLSTLNLAHQKDLINLTDADLSDTFHFRCKALLRPHGDIDVLLDLSKRLDEIHTTRC